VIRELSRHSTPVRCVEAGDILSVRHTQTHVDGTVEVTEMGEHVITGPLVIDTIAFVELTDGFGFRSAIGCLFGTGA
jgi:hypothetical protein